MAAEQQRLVQRQKACKQGKLSGSSAKNAVKDGTSHADGNQPQALQLAAIGKACCGSSHCGPQVGFAGPAQGKRQMMPQLATAPREWSCPWQKTVVACGTEWGVKEGEMRESARAAAL